MSGSVNHIIRSTYKPKISIRIFACCIPCYVPTLSESGVIHFRVVPIPMEHGWPTWFNHQVPIFSVGNFIEILIHYGYMNSRDRFSHGTRPYLHTWIVGTHYGSGLSLPPVVVKWHSKHIVTPNYCFWIQRLTHTTHIPQGRKIKPSRNLLPCLHQHSNCRGGCIPNCHFVLLNLLIPSACTKSAFINQLSYTICPWSQHAIRSSCDPPRICRTPVNVIVM